MIRNKTQSSHQSSETVQSASRQTKGRTSQRRRLNRVAAADYQTLEPRLALTTFLVNTAVDDLDGTMPGLSLREAVIAANTDTAFGDATAGTANGDVIRFDASLVGETLTLTGGQLEITNDLVIQGGASGITINGNSDRIFQISTSERVVISDLNLAAGLADVGGAIASTGGGDTIVVNVNFDGNTAAGLGGGAIYHEVGNLYVTNSNFSNNQANGASGSGGAILSASGVSAISGGTMVGNSANRAGGAIEVIAGQFYATNASVGMANNGNFAGVGGGANPGNGGGLHVTGEARVVISGGQFVGNFAAREGGGLWNQAGTTMFIQGNALIAGNLAAGPAADDGGGGIFNNGGELYVNISQLSTNGASGVAGSGGGIFSTAGNVIILDSKLLDNSAARAGGGVEIVDGFLRFANTIVSGNDAGIDYTATPGNGGGLHVTGVSTVVVDGGTFSGNVAASEGGGLWNQVGSQMFVREGAVIDNNTAQGEDADNGGGGLFNNGGNLYLNGVAVSNNKANGVAGSGGGIFTTAGNVIITNSLIDSNAAVRAGGGVEVVTGYVGIDYSAVSNNDAGITIAAAPGNGGGLHVTGVADVVVRGGQFAFNRAANQGGGLWNQTDANLYLRNKVVIRNNTALNGTAVGGGVYNKGYLQAVDTFFRFNSATTLGGGIFVAETGRAQVSSSRLGGNSAGQRGGAVYNSNITSIRDSVFETNTAGISDAAIGADSSATTVSQGNTFIGNVVFGIGGSNLS